MSGPVSTKMLVYCRDINFYNRAIFHFGGLTMSDIPFDKVSDSCRCVPSKMAWRKTSTWPIYCDSMVSNLVWLTMAMPCCMLICIHILSQSLRTCSWSKVIAMGLPTWDYKWSHWVFNTYFSGKEHHFGVGPMMALISYIFPFGIVDGARISLVQQVYCFAVKVDHTHHPSTILWVKSCGGFLKWGTSKSSMFNRIFRYHWIWGTLHLWNPPICAVLLQIWVDLFCGRKRSQVLCGSWVGIETGTPGPTAKFRGVQFQSVSIGFMHFRNVDVCVSTVKSFNAILLFGL